MLVLRFLLMLGAIACVASLGMFFLTRDRRYLRLAGQLFRLFLVMILAMAVVLAMGRILLF